MNDKEEARAELQAEVRREAKDNYLAQMQRNSLERMAGYGE